MAPVPCTHAIWKKNKSSQEKFIQGTTVQSPSAPRPGENGGEVEANGAIVL
jgi:hypothetical protein